METQASRRGVGVALALVSASAFATLGLFAKFIYAAGLSVQQALAWRFTVAAAMLWAYAIARGGWRRPWSDYRRAILLGVFGFAPQAGLYFITVRYLNPGLAGLLLYLYPAFVILLSVAFLGKKPRRAQIAALLLSTAGCALTLWSRGEYPAVGYAFGLAVALSYAVYLVAGEKALASLEPAFATTVVMSSAAAVYWLITVATGKVLVPARPSAILAILGVSLVGTVVPIVCLFTAMRRIGAADASLVSTVEPLVTIALSAAILGERLNCLQLAGGALIIAALLALNLWPAARSGRNDNGLHAAPPEKTD